MPMHGVEHWALQILETRGKQLIEQLGGAVVTSTPSNEARDARASLDAIFDELVARLRFPPEISGHPPWTGEDHAHKVMHFLDLHLPGMVERGLPIGLLVETRDGQWEGIIHRISAAYETGRLPSLRLRLGDMGKRQIGVGPVAAERYNTVANILSAEASCETCRRALRVIEGE